MEPVLYRHSEHHALLCVQVVAAALCLWFEMQGTKRKVRRWLILMVAFPILGFCIMIAALYLYGKGLADGVGDHSSQASAHAVHLPPQNVSPRRLSERPLDWGVSVEADGHIFPSLILAFAQSRPESANWLTVSLRSAPVGSQLRLVVNMPGFSRESMHQFVYQGPIDVRPSINWDFERLQKVREPQLVRAVVQLYVNQVLTGEQAVTCTIRPVNDAIIRLRKGDGTVQSTALTLTAFVNEDHPLIPKVLQVARAKSGVTFLGYQDNGKTVQQQLKAIWDTVAASGVRYSSIPGTSFTHRDVAVQHVRLLEDVINVQGANCVDGTVLFASVCKRIGLEPLLMIIPGHCYFGVRHNAGNNECYFLETTMLGSGSFEQAMDQGTAQFQKDAIHFQSKDVGYEAVDVFEARKAGIAPIVAR